MNLTLDIRKGVISNHMIAKNNLNKKQVMRSNKKKELVEKNLTPKNLLVEYEPFNDGKYYEMWLGNSVEFYQNVIKPALLELGYVFSDLKQAEPKFYSGEAKNITLCFHSNGAYKHFQLAYALYPTKSDYLNNINLNNINSYNYYLTKSFWETSPFMKNKNSTLVDVIWTNPYNKLIPLHVLRRNSPCSLGYNDIKLVDELFDGKITRLPLEIVKQLENEGLTFNYINKKPETKSTNILTEYELIYKNGRYVVWIGGDIEYYKLVKSKLGEFGIKYGDTWNQEEKALLNGEGKGYTLFTEEGRIRVREWEESQLLNLIKPCKYPYEHPYYRTPYKILTREFFNSIPIGKPKHIFDTLNGFYGYYVSIGKDITLFKSIIKKLLHLGIGEEEQWTPDIFKKIEENKYNCNLLIQYHGTSIKVKLYFNADMSGGQKLTPEDFSNFTECNYKWYLGRIFPETERYSGEKKIESKNSNILTEYEPLDKNGSYCVWIGGVVEYYKFVKKELEKFGIKYDNVWTDREIELLNGSGDTYSLYVYKGKMWVNGNYKSEDELMSLVNLHGYKLLTPKFFSSLTDNKLKTDYENSVIDITKDGFRLPFSSPCGYMIRLHNNVQLFTSIIRKLLYLGIGEDIFWTPEVLKRIENSDCVLYINSQVSEYIYVKFDYINQNDDIVRAIDRQPSIGEQILLARDFADYKETIDTWLLNRVFPSKEPNKETYYMSESKYTANCKYKQRSTEIRNLNCESIQTLDITKGSYKIWIGANKELYKSLKTTLLNMGIKSQLVGWIENGFLSGIPLNYAMYIDKDGFWINNYKCDFETFISPLSEYSEFKLIAPEDLALKIDGELFIIENIEKAINAVADAKNHGFNSNTPKDSGGLINLPKEQTKILGYIK